MEKRLEEIKRLNEEKKNKKSRLEGKLETAKEQMKGYSCDTIEQLNDLLKEKEEQLAKTKIEINNKLEILEHYVQ